MMSRCIMNEAKQCTHCGQCEVCDLDPNKICDNCCKCIETQQEDERYAVLPVQLQPPDDGDYSTADVKWEGENASPDDNDDDCYECEFWEEDSEEEDYIAEPLDIDPHLMQAWEEKLRASLVKMEGERDKLPALHAQRIKKRKD